MQRGSKMIKLDRNACPPELTQEIREELTILYIRTGEDVWKDARIKEPIKQTLLAMSNNKCAYCECKIGKENNYFTTEHFIPKSSSKFKVLEWDNLLPVCSKCNGSKTGNTLKIINPCIDVPNDYLRFDFTHFFYKYMPKNKSSLGKNTCDVLGLNAMSSRLNRQEIGERAKDTCEKICISINKSINKAVKNHNAPKLHFSHRDSFYDLLNMCTDDKQYSSVISSALFSLPIFLLTVNNMKLHGIWNSSFDKPFSDLVKNKLESSND